MTRLMVMRVWTSVGAAVQRRRLDGPAAELPGPRVSSAGGAGRGNKDHSRPRPPRAFPLPENVRGGEGRQQAQGVPQTHHPALIGPGSYARDTRTSGARHARTKTSPAATTIATPARPDRAPSPHRAYGLRVGTKERLGARTVAGFAAEIETPSHDCRTGRNRDT
jgi:hypothetical protein